MLQIIACADNKDELLDFPVLSEFISKTVAVANEKFGCCVYCREVTLGEVIA